MAKNHSTRANGARTPAVGYIRMSTDKQEDSPEQQRAEILKLADREGCRIIRWYEDHAISGAKTHKRKQFRQMIRDAEEIGDFTAILCWDQDRFGRFDSIEAGEWISPLRRAGVELITVVQGRIDWNDFAGRLIYQINQEGKHRYLVDLSRNSLRGMIRFAKQGHLLGFPTPYGYDRLYFDAAGKEMCSIPRGQRFRKPRDWTATLVPSARRQDVKTVRWLFKTFAGTDRSARSLAVELNRRKVPSPNGGEWDYAYVKKILRHPVYIGWLTYGRRSAGLYHHVGADGEIVSAGSKIDHNGRYAPIIVENHHEPLIDKATFEAVQAKLKERSKKQGGPFRRYLLSGTLICGHCGSILVGAGQGGGRKKNGYAYYKCKRSRDSGTCANYAVRTEHIEPVVLEHFRQVWLSENGRKALQQAIGSLNRERQQEEPQRLEGMQAELNRLERQIAQGTENLLLADPADVPAANAVLAGWRDERERLNAEIAAVIRTDPGKPDYDPEAIIAELDQLEESITADNVLLAKAAIKRVFKRVTLFWKQVSPKRRELVEAQIEAHYPFV